MYPELKPVGLRGVHGSAPPSERKSQPHYSARPLGYASSAFIYLLLFVGGAWLLFRGVREFREQGEWTAFILPLIVAVRGRAAHGRTLERKNHRSVRPAQR
jgi:hypothetical protein